MSRHYFYRNWQQISVDRCVECCSSNELMVMGCLLLEFSIFTFAAYSIQLQYCGKFSFFVSLLRFIRQGNPVYIYIYIWFGEFVAIFCWWWCCWDCCYFFEILSIVFRFILIGIKCRLTIFICLYIYSMVVSGFEYENWNSTGMKIDLLHHEYMPFV